MDNISDLLAHRNLSEPPEIHLIKDFILKKYNENVVVKVELSKIIIYVNSSAFANTIKMNIPEIQKVCASNKRISIYINN